MSIGRKATEFAEYRVVEFDPAEGIVLPPTTDALRGALLEALRANPDDVASRNALLDYMSERGEALPSVARRIECDLYGTGGRDMKASEICHLESFLADPAVCLVEAVVVGACWDINYGTDSSRTVAAIIGARQRLARLRALFLGDILGEEFEISWIQHRDITGLFDALPALEHFKVRGAEGLELRPIRHERLKSLVIEASNLRREVVLALGESRLPALEHLEIWLGDPNYQADTTPDDLAGILRGEGLPSLRRLGLRNADIANELPRVLAGAPILERLESLDLSMGTMTDEGAEALLAVPGLERLDLDLTENHLSPAMVSRLHSLDRLIDADNQQEADVYQGETYRYVVHSE